MPPSDEAGDMQDGRRPGYNVIAKKSVSSVFLTRKHQPPFNELAGPSGEADESNYSAGQFPRPVIPASFGTQLAVRTEARGFSVGRSRDLFSSAHNSAVPIGSERESRKEHQKNLSEDISRASARFSSLSLGGARISNATLLSERSPEHDLPPHVAPIRDPRFLFIQGHFSEQLPKTASPPNPPAEYNPPTNLWGDQTAHQHPQDWKHTRTSLPSSWPPYQEQETSPDRDQISASKRNGQRAVTQAYFKPCDSGSIINPGTVSLPSVNNTPRWEHSRSRRNFSPLPPLDQNCSSPDSRNSSFGHVPKALEQWDRRLQENTYLSESSRPWPYPNDRIQGNSKIPSDDLTPRSSWDSQYSLNGQPSIWGLDGLPPRKQSQITCSRPSFNQGYSRASVEQYESRQQQKVYSSDSDISDNLGVAKAVLDEEGSEKTHTRGRAQNYESATPRSISIDSCQGLPYNGCTQEEIEFLRQQHNEPEKVALTKEIEDREIKALREKELRAIKDSYSSPARHRSPHADYPRTSRSTPAMTSRNPMQSTQPAAQQTGVMNTRSLQQQNYEMRLLQEKEAKQGRSRFF